MGTFVERAIWKWRHRHDPPRAPDFIASLWGSEVFESLTPTSFTPIFSESPEEYYGIGRVIHIPNYAALTSPKSKDVATPVFVDKLDHLRSVQVVAGRESEHDLG